MIDGAVPTLVDIVNILNIGWTQEEVEGKRVSKKQSSRNGGRFAFANASPQQLEQTRATLGNVSPSYTASLRYQTFPGWPDTRQKLELTM